ncbi:helix-turn-helix domain-containing protein [Thermococcus aggregans]|uniref:Helix-turn-helix domain-containing protein n=1 Tax=Thermococcus aggregans TaxID=110163 RepID=A0A9E7SP42_THEAG|nr:helix-turn-helix domain-containing protein [Thermococcus aggregans]USS41049.1 helix-turn-helix domain-containing protein [Thermococcus aggregans]
MDVSDLIKKGESETLEFKRELNDSVYKTLSAFANTDGGILLLGVGDDGNIYGFSGDLDSLARSIRHNLGINPSIKAEEIGGKKVIIIEVSKSPVPISFRGRYYKRVGAQTVEMGWEDLQRFFLQKSGVTWDSLPSSATLKDLDEETIRKFVHMARNRLPYINENEDVESILDKLGLLEDGKITNAALLLFGKEPQRYYIQAKVRIGRFKDPITIIDDKEIGGNLFTQVEEAMRIIMGHIGVRYEFEGGLRRKEVWDYPLDALREAIINALIHRDYTDPSNVQIKIFDDFIWIWNPGKLPEGISLEDLKKEMHPSKLRNPKIAQVFYYAGLIERWGTGTFKIVRLCLESGLPEPEFREEAGGFVVLLRKDIYTEEHLRKLGLSERQIKAVLYVKEKGSITNKEYQELFKVSRQTATRDLSELVKLGIFERVEKGRYKLKTHHESNMSQP